MQERTLLWLAFVLATAGLIVLALLPDLPREDTIARVAWSNGTDARVVVERELWVRFETPTELSEGMCVHLRGIASSNNLESTRLVRVRPPSPLPCQISQG